VNIPKAPKWLRTFDVIIGLIGVILSVAVLVYQELAILTLILFLSVALLVIGVARVLTGIFASYLSDGVRTLNFGTGLMAIVLALMSMLYTNLTTQVLIFLLAIVMLLNGVVRVVIGGFERAYPKWFRGLLVVVGASTITVSAVVCVYSNFGFLVLVLMLSFTFMFNGIARIAQGIIGIKETET
jgi:uncharacterized membrane protein HdeD (DUF308 family)